MQEQNAKILRMSPSVAANRDKGINLVNQHAPVDFLFVSVLTPKIFREGCDLRSLCTSGASRSFVTASPTGTIIAVQLKSGPIMSRFLT
jgi:hypothetical protein